MYHIFAVENKIEMKDVKKTMNIEEINTLTLMYNP